MKKVMVAIDKRDEAAGLGAVAAALARDGTLVDVVHVHEFGSAPGFAEADAAVAEVVDVVRCRGVEARGHVVSTDAGVACRLVRHARQLDAEIVVMGSRGLGRVGGLGGRSVSHAVLAELDVPVLILSDHARLPIHGFRHALAAVASEADADPVVKAVGLLPGVAQVQVVHVPRRVAVHVGRPGDTFAEIGETSTLVLSRAVERFEAAGIPVAAQTAEREGGVAASIAKAASVWDADVVVLGAHRPGSWEALVAGSTLHDVLRQTDRPVLVAAR